MATMIERYQLGVARGRAVTARKNWRLHRKICRLCAQLSKNRSQYCDDGWALRVELHHAEQDLALRKLPPDSQQGILL